MNPFTRYPVRLSLGLASIFFFLLLSCFASGSRPSQAYAYFIHDRIELSARIYPTLTPILEEALKSGLSLPFTYEFQLTKPKFYAWTQRLMHWFEPTATLHYRLSYEALTGQYRVSTGGFYRNFTSLKDALAGLGILHGWQVLPNTQVARAPDHFMGKIRLRLNRSHLPKPYQFTAIGNTDWEFDSGWIKLTVAQANQDE